MQNKKVIVVLFVLALCLQLGILLSFQAVKREALDQGRRIVVEVVPVDPRSLFRGDYVVLQYPFSRIRKNAENAGFFKTPLAKGTPLFIRLSATKRTDSERLVLRSGEIVGEKWEPTAIDVVPVECTGDDEIMLQGVVHAWSEDAITLRFDIESYFVSEGEGKEIEKNIRAKKVEAMLAVDQKGKASLVKLFVDGVAIK